MVKFPHTFCSQCGQEFGPGDSGYSHCDDHRPAVKGLTLQEARQQINKLRTALARLSNEVIGSLPLMEPLARREFGNSNYNILIQRAEEARALLLAT